MGEFFLYLFLHKIAKQSVTVSRNSYSFHLSMTTCFGLKGAIIGRTLKEKFNIIYTVVQLCSLYAIPYELQCLSVFRIIKFL